jgi:hypothetical protein
VIKIAFQHLQQQQPLCFFSSSLIFASPFRS